MTKARLWPVVTGAIAAVLWLTIAESARSTPQVFTNRAAWEQQVGATTCEGFELEPIPDFGVVSLPYTTAQGTVLSGPNSLIVVQYFKTGAPNGSASFHIRTFPPAKLRFTFSSLRNAFGFDYETTIQEPWTVTANGVSTGLPVSTTGFVGYVDTVPIPFFDLSADNDQGRGIDIDNLCQPVPQNHFKCYSVDGTRLDTTVNLADQFGEGATFVREPKFLCNPVNKNGEGTPSPLAHLVCYQIKVVAQKRDVLVNNQFGQAELTVRNSEILCVPSNKLPCPPDTSVDISTGQTDTSGSQLWQLTSAPPGTLGGFPHPSIAISPNAAWLTFPGTSWVSANSGCNTTTSNCPAGLYSYQLCWEQCGRLGSLQLKLHADNNARVYLDGSLIGSTPANGFGTTTTINVSDPGPGERHCFRIDVNNLGGPTGVDVKATLTGAVKIVP
jgi:hypothetical protein